MFDLFNIESNLIECLHAIFISNDFHVETSRNDIIDIRRVLSQKLIIFNYL